MKAFLSCVLLACFFACQAVAIEECGSEHMKKAAFRHITFLLGKLDSDNPKRLDPFPRMNEVPKGDVDFTVHPHLSYKGHVKLHPNTFGARGTKNSGMTVTIVNKKFQKKPEQTAEPSLMDQAKDVGKGVMEYSRAANVKVKLCAYKFKGEFNEKNPLAKPDKVNELLTSIRSASKDIKFNTPEATLSITADPDHRFVYVVYVERQSSVFTDFEFAITMEKTEGRFQTSG